MAEGVNRRANTLRRPLVRWPSVHPIPHKGPSPPFPETVKRGQALQRTQYISSRPAGKQIHAERPSSRSTGSPPFLSCELPKGPNTGRTPRVLGRRQRRILTKKRSFKANAQFRASQIPDTLQLQLVNAIATSNKTTIEGEYKPFKTSRPMGYLYQR